MKNKIKQHFVPYELSLRLKELGFDEDVIACYLDKEIYKNQDYDFLSLKHYSKNSEIGKSFTPQGNSCSAPLYSQAFDWFRDEHGLSSYIVSRMSYNIQKNYFIINELSERKTITVYE